jgi:hypothetical protein
MTAWVILIGFGVAVLGVIAKVVLDVAGDLRADREAHGGRLTTTAARRAVVIAVIVTILVLVLIVWPLVLSDT